MSNQEQTQFQTKQEETTQPAAKRLVISVRKLEKAETTDWRHIVHQG